MTKKNKEVSKPVPAKVVTVESSATKFKRVEDEWSRDQEAANRSYDQYTASAWVRYLTALKEHLKDNPKASTRGSSFDAQYDKDRDNALRDWHRASAVAEDKRHAAEKQIVLADIALQEARNRVKMGENG